MKLLKTLAATLFISIATTLPAAAAQATAMIFWAEWCHACKILDPALDKAIAEYEGDIDILRLDFTDLSFQNLQQQVARAEAIGAADFVPVVGLKTGYGLIIVDGENRGRISAGMDTQIMHQVFDAALAK